MHSITISERIFSLWDLESEVFLLTYELPSLVYDRNFLTMFWKSIQLFSYALKFDLHFREAILSRLWNIFTFSFENVTLLLSVLLLMLLLTSLSGAASYACRLWMVALLIFCSCTQPGNLIVFRFSWLPDCWSFCSSGWVILEEWGRKSILISRHLAVALWLLLELRAIYKIETAILMTVAWGILAIWWTHPSYLTLCALQNAGAFVIVIGLFFVYCSWKVVNLSRPST